jgi:glycosyltransferase involved in cell wall biosynthesis
MPTPTEEIVALIPGYQEGPRVGAVVEAARTHLAVIVVDDGSTDDTADVAEVAGATVIRQVPNAGKGAALRTGFRHALERGCAAVITLDADGQHDPAEIPAFVEAFRARRPELVIGLRDFGAMPPVRRLSNTLGGLTLSAALGRNVPDNQSGYRLVGRVLMRAMLESQESGFEFEVEMIARAIALGLPIEWVPIRTIYAGEPSHIEPWRHFREFVRMTVKARRIARGSKG